MKTSTLIQKVGIHTLVWVSAFFLSILLIPGYSVRINWGNMLISWGIYVVVFYLNYLVLIPRLFSRKWAVLYAVCTLVLLMGAFVLIRYTAMESAREDTQFLRDELQQYEDVQASLTEKERIRETQQNIESKRRMEEQWQRAENQNGSRSETVRGGNRGGAMPARRPDRDNAMAVPPPPPAGTPGTLGTLGNLTGEMNGLQFPDSAYWAEYQRMWYEQVRRADDSLLRIVVTLTPREETLWQLRREYFATRSYAWELSRNDYNHYNPFQQQNLPFVFALIIFYMASIVTFFVEQGNKAEKRRRELEKERVKAELAYLKQQINPHFLFNTLNSIYSYTISVSQEASDAVLKLSSILRYMLYETNRDRVPLPDELAVIDDYIELQKMRMTDKTQIEVIVRGDTRRYQIEPMLLIPIIENAFKYGVDSVEASFVRIEIEVEGGDFTFRVTNRVVRRNDGDRSHSGIGIQNIQRRLELIYGADHYDMDVSEKDGIFSVTLHLNLKD
ncbi:MAG: histidine kinase [Rikenellaceae bacterium]|jgi:sensor histidine kinase YesM|nr:histidine kinase [Rikenellaceae bacterium]